MKRKTIQLITHFQSDGRYFIVALCDDGSMWKLSGLYEGKPEWEKFVTPPEND